MGEINNRNQLLDATKGVAIILVILGHAVQQCSGLDNHTALNLWIERFILSFHMPLFMLVSGYLFYFSLRRHSEKDILRNRFKMFVIPIVTMSLFHHITPRLVHFDLGNFFMEFPYSLFNSLWFFWAMLIVTLFMCLVHRWLNDSIWGYVAVVSVTLLLPDAYPLRAYVHLLPVFALAYLFAKYKNNSSGGESHSLVSVIVILTVVASMFFLLLPYFRYDNMIYFSRYSLLGSIDILTDIKRDVFRFGIGVLGSLMILLSLHLVISMQLISRKVLAGLTHVGSMTFGIYIFQDFMLIVFGPINRHLLDKSHYVVNSAISFIVIFFMAILLTKLAEKRKWASLLFLGKSC